MLRDRPTEVVVRAHSITEHGEREVSRGAMFVSRIPTYGGDVLSARALRGMLDFDQAAGLPCAIPCPLPYGLGAFRYDIGGRLSYGHDGSSGAIVAYFPTERVTIAILTNGGRQATGTFLLAMMRAVPGLARDRGRA